MGGWEGGDTRLNQLGDHTCTHTGRSMCLPSRVVIAQHIQSVTDSLGIRKVYIASDSNPDIPDLQERLGPLVSKNVGVFLHTWIYKGILEYTKVLNGAQKYAKTTSGGD